MIQIALFKKFLSKQFIARVEVSNIARCSSKTNELRDIDSMGCRTRNITIYNGKLTISKSKVVTFIINLGRNNINSN